MVSLLSFFQSKKKSKRPLSSPTSPTSSSSLPQPKPAGPSSNPSQQTDPTSRGGPSASAGASSSSSRPRPAGRFLSLRHKSSSGGRPSARELNSRRASSELSRKRSQVKGSKNDAFSEPLTSTFKTVLPQLDLGFDVNTPGDSPGAGRQNNDLGLLGVGVRVELTENEVEILDKLDLAVEDVKLAWIIFGQALRESNLNTVGLMLPHRLDSDHSTQLYLLSLYALIIKPNLLPSFPTIAAQFAQPSSDPSKVWTERLKAIVRDIEHPSDLAEVLKYTLRRLRSSQSLASDPDPLINAGVYTNFVRAEHASSYPLDAYSTLLVPKLQPGLPVYLEEIFEVWSAIATHADENTMTAGRLAYLLGWWVLHFGVTRGAEWEKLYKDWQAAGRRIEHLLYAWIRYQSTRMQIPTRLLEIVDNYPFGGSTASSEHLPLPPPSSFPRQTLHVTLSSTILPQGHLRSPEDLLKTALSAKQDEDALVPCWTSLNLEYGDQTDLATVVAEDSMAFLRKAAQATSPPSTPSGSAAPQQTPVQTDDGPPYRPFSTVSAGRTSPRTRAFSQDASSTPLLASSSSSTPLAGHVSDLKPYKEVKKQSSMSVLSNSAGAGGRSVWDDFSKSGFSDSPNTFGELGLAFAPQSPTAPLSPTGYDVQLPSEPKRPVNKKRTTFQESQDTRRAEYAITGEEIIEIDDTFLSFVEDAQLDTRCVATWPPFVLVRLAAPIVCDANNDKPIEWLLVTVTHRPPPPPPPEPEVVEPEFRNRPTSPASSKQGTPRGFRDLASSFKRSSSFQSSMGLRRSFFGTSAFSLSRHVSDDLGTLPESQIGESRELRAPPSAQSLAPTEYTIGEMGEIIKIPSTAEKAERTVPPAAIPATLDTPPKEADEVTIKCGEKIVPGLCNETSAKDWKYNGEGAEHIVFSYRGHQPTNIGNVLRIKKSTLAIALPPSHVEAKPVHAAWRDELLPKLVSPKLLLQAKTVDLEQSWAKELLVMAESVRPEKRRDGAGKGLADLITSDIQALVMEDTTINENGDDKVTLAVEIKPKWGFLPSAEWITPPEAVSIKSQNCRFCLHSHLRAGISDSEKGFCPLDLYSGDDAKMTLAVDHLWQMWVENGGKGNNWRMFINGDKINPDQVGTIPDLTGESTLSAKIASLVIPALRSSQALDQLRTLQSTLDPTDVSNLAVRFAAAHSDAPLFDSPLIPTPTTAELEEFVDLYLSAPQAGKDREDKWTLRQRLIAYALSAIFKDCSVFVKITLAKLDSGAWEALKGSEKVKIVDLDLKPIQNMSRWYERDLEIWRHWLHTKASTQSANPTIITEEDGRGQDAEQTVGKDSHIVADQPIRQKTVSGLTVLTSSAEAEDGASTRAMFAPTPDVTGRGTPLSAAEPDPDEAIAAAQDEPNVEERLLDASAVTVPVDISAAPSEAVTDIEPNAASEAIRISAQSHAEEDAPVAGHRDEVNSVDDTINTEIRQRTESMATSLSDQPARKERSLAPSPSPSVGNHDLPAPVETDTSYEPEVARAGPGAIASTERSQAVNHSDSTKVQVDAAEEDAVSDTVQNVSSAQEVRELAYPVPDELLEGVSATPKTIEKPDSADDRRHQASPTKPEHFEKEQDMPRGGLSSPGPIENEAFFTPAETPLLELQEPIIALANTLPTIPSNRVPNQVEITEHKNEPRLVEQDVAFSEGPGTPNLRIIPIEDATPKQESTAHHHPVRDESVEQGSSTADTKRKQDASTVLALEENTDSTKVGPGSEPSRNEESTATPANKQVMEQDNAPQVDTPVGALAPSGSIPSSDTSTPDVTENVGLSHVMPSNALSGSEERAHQDNQRVTNPEYSARSAHVLQLGEPISAKETNDVADASSEEPQIPDSAFTIDTQPEPTSEVGPTEMDPQDIIPPISSDTSTFQSTGDPPAETDISSHQTLLDIPHHELDSISDGGESAIPSTTDMSRNNTDDDGRVQSELGSASDRGDEWVEDVNRELEETPKTTRNPELSVDGENEQITSMSFHQGHSTTNNVDESSVAPASGSILIKSDALSLTEDSEDVRDRPETSVDDSGKTIEVQETAHESTPNFTTRIEDDSATLSTEAQPTGDASVNAASTENAITPNPQPANR
ncbi:hypothetical protein IAU59_003734 [Kwoniella sp. CBS 9459]